MKRYDFDIHADYSESVDGGWIRYSDHVEAMRRIAGASPWASVNPATTLADRIGDLPEINFSNYNESDVEALNEWAIEAYTLLAATPAQQDETIAQPTDEQILLLAANFMDANSFEHNKAEFVRWFRKLLTEPAPVGEMPFSKAHEIVSMLDVQTRAQLESLARRSHGGRFPVYMSPDDARALLAASPADQVRDNYERAYRHGWINCAKWADRVDLVADIDSPAYNKDRDEAMKLVMSATPPASD